MTSAHAAHRPDGDIQLVTLWRAVRRSFKGLVLFAGFVAGATYAVQSLMAPRFTSESQLEFVAKRSNPFPESGDRPAGPDNAARLDQAAINTHARAILSSDLLLRVADELKLLVPVTLLALRSVPLRSVIDRPPAQLGWCGPDRPGPCDDANRTGPPVSNICSNRVSRHAGRTNFRTVLEILEHLI